MISFANEGSRGKDLHPHYESPPQGLCTSTTRKMTQATTMHPEAGLHTMPEPTAGGALIVPLGPNPKVLEPTADKEGDLPIDPEHKAKKRVLGREGIGPTEPSPWMMLGATKPPGKELPEIGVPAP